ncbi:MAG TPA: 4Fe-4S dicluster domain-containing protein [Salinivirgaceae bacterium]|nr:4Fe-4S dicluster domain-containing protein [Salinivirgaceae bacterium]
MKNFGYKPAPSRQYDMDAISQDLYHRLIEKEPSALRCLMCGACVATCMANSINGFNVRFCHLLLKRGKIDMLGKELEKCLLCGKCQMVCPRGINTRSLVVRMQEIISELTFKHLP